MSVVRELVERTREFVKTELEGMEGSHDFYHIVRVYNMTCKLAREENLSEADTLIAELGALLHDIADWKYAGSDEAGPAKAEAFLRSQQAGACDEATIAGVIAIIRGVSFHSELGGAGSKTDITPALAVVQDADRLDAIGAIGVARCFAYGGSKKRALYDPEVPPVKDLTKDAYMKSNSASVNHFYEKLLRLKGMLKTEAGRRTAEARHTFMETFLERFYDEWEGRA
eukprot:UC1_evm4s1666